MSNPDSTEQAGITGTIKDAIDSVIQRYKLTVPYEPVHLTSGLRESLQSALRAHTDSAVLRLRPYREGDGLLVGEEFVSELHTHMWDYSALQHLIRGRVQDAPQPLSYEFWWDGDYLNLNYVVPDDQYYGVLNEHVLDYYPDAELTTQERAWPRIDGHYYVSGGTLELKHPRYRPIETYEIDEEENYEPDRDPDPLKSLTGSMAARTDEKVLVQVVMRPAADNWTEGRFYEEPAETIGKYYDMQQFEKTGPFSYRNRDPKEWEQDYSNYLKGLDEQTAFDVNIRYFVFSPRAQSASRTASDIGQTFERRFQTPEYKQRFKALPIHAVNMEEALTRTGRRDLVDREVTLTASELAGIVHPPNKTAVSPAISWTNSGGGGIGRTEGDHAGEESFTEATGETDITEKITIDTSITTTAPPIPDEFQGRHVKPDEDNRSLRWRYHRYKQTWNRHPIAQTKALITQPLKSVTRLAQSASGVAQTHLSSEATGAGDGEILHDTHGFDDPSDFDSMRQLDDDEVELLRNILTTSGYDTHYEKYHNAGLSIDAIASVYTNHGDKVTWAIRNEIEKPDDLDTALYDEGRRPGCLVTAHAEDSASAQPAAEGDIDTEEPTAAGETVSEEAKASPADQTQQHAPSPDNSTPNANVSARRSADGGKPATEDTQPTETQTESTTEPTPSSPTDTTTTTSAASQSENLPEPASTADDSAPGSTDTTSTDSSEDDVELRPSDPGPVEAPSGASYDTPLDLTITDTERELYTSPKSGWRGEIETVVHTEEEGPLLGRDLDELLIQSQSEHPDQPIFMGLAQGRNAGVREVGIPEAAWNIHGWEFGSSGAGKTTSFVNKAHQVIEKGHGTLLIDPKGDFATDVLRRIPEDRWEDVIYVDPADKRFSKSVALNFLEEPTKPSDIEKNTAIESQIEDLIGALKGDDVFGKRMDGIAQTMANAMIRSRRNYTLVDMFKILNDPEALDTFVDSVKDEGLEMEAEFAETIRQMDHDLIEPLIRRIKDWAENPITRSIIANRESTVDFDQAVDEGKIIVVSPSVQKKSSKRLIAVAVIRRIWSAVRSRQEEGKDLPPFFAFIDELHEIINENFRLPEILALARSANLGLYVASQNPEQIEEDIIKQIFGNTKYQAAFQLENDEDAERVAKQFDETVEGGDLSGLPQYQFKHKPLIDDDLDAGIVPGKATTVKSLPPTPPRWTHNEVTERLRKRLDETGKEPNENALSELELILDRAERDDLARHCMLEAIWESEIRSDTGTGRLPLKEVIPQFNQRYSTDFEDLTDGVYIPTSYVDCEYPQDAERATEPATEQHEGGEVTLEHLAHPSIEVSITETGKQHVLDSGDLTDRQKASHRHGLRETFVTLAKTGYVPTVKQQRAQEKAPDGEGDIPIDTDDAPLSVLTERVNEFIENNEVVSRLSGGRPLRIESESNTFKKPAMTLAKASRADDDGQVPLYVTPHVDDLDDDRDRDRGYAPSALADAFTDPPLRKESTLTPPKTSEADPLKEEAYILYNKRNPVPLDVQTDTTLYPLIERSGSGRDQAWWVSRPDDPMIRLYDGRGDDATEWASLRPETVFDADPTDFKAYAVEKADGSYTVHYANKEKTVDNKTALEAEYLIVPQPLVPRVEFNIDDPTQFDYQVLHRAPAVTGSDGAASSAPNDSSTDEDPTEEEGEEEEAGYGGPLTHYTPPQYPVDAGPTDEVWVRASKLPLVYNDGDYEWLFSPDEWDDKQIVDDITGNPEASKQHINLLAEYREGVHRTETLTSPDTALEPVTYHPHDQPAERDGEQFGGNAGSEESATTADDTPSRPMRNLDRYTPTERSTYTRFDPTEADVVHDAARTAEQASTYDFWLELVDPDLTGPEDILVDQTVPETKLADGEVVTRDQLRGMIIQNTSIAVDGPADDAIEIGVEAGWLITTTAEDYLRQIGGDAWESGIKQLPNVEADTQLFAIVTPKTRPGELIPPEHRFTAADWEDIFEGAGDSQAAREERALTQVIRVTLNRKDENVTRGLPTEVVTKSLIQLGVINTHIQHVETRPASDTEDNTDQHLYERIRTRYDQRVVDIWEYSRSTIGEDTLPWDVLLDSAMQTSSAGFEQAKAEVNRLVDAGAIEETNGQYRAVPIGNGTEPGHTGTHSEHDDDDDNDDHGPVGNPPSDGPPTSTGSSSDHSAETSMTDIAGTDDEQTNTPDSSTTEADTNGADAGTEVLHGLDEEQETAPDSTDTEDETPTSDKLESIMADPDINTPDLGEADSKPAPPVQEALTAAAEAFRAAALAPQTLEQAKILSPFLTATTHSVETWLDDVQSIVDENDGELPHWKVLEAARRHNGEHGYEEGAHRWEQTLPYDPDTLPGDWTVEEIAALSPPTDEGSLPPIHPEDYFTDALYELTVDNGTVSLTRHAPDRLPDSRKHDLKGRLYAVTSRGWSEDIADEKYLGYAPNDSEALLDRLLQKGITREQMLAASLFRPRADLTELGAPEKAQELGYIPSDPSSIPTTEEESAYPVDDNPDDHDGSLAEYYDLKLPQTLKDRFVFPYFNSQNDPVYFITRRPPHSDNGPKYQKLSQSADHTFVEEPIYGIPSINEGDPLVITEGMADAITCHDFGIPAISPVTTQFKDKHVDPVNRLIDEYDIPTVYIINDTDIPTATVAAEADDTEKVTLRTDPSNLQDATGLGQTVPETDTDYKRNEQAQRIAARPLTQENLTIEETGSNPDPEFADQLLSVDEAETHQGGQPTTDIAVPSALVSGSHRVKLNYPVPTGSGSEEIDGALSLHNAGRNISLGQRGPIGDRLTVKHSGAGVKSAVTLVEKLERGSDVDIRMLHLPAFGPEGVDLDDYLQGGWLELIPPLPWVFHVYSEVGTADITQYDPDPDDSWITHLACNGDMQISSRANDVGQTAAAMPQNRREASSTPDRDHPPFEDPTPEVPTDGSIDSREDLPPAIRWIDKPHIPASAGSNHAARDDPYSRIGYDNDDPATKGREREWMEKHFDVLSPGEEAGTWTPTRDPTDEVPRTLPVADWFGMVPAIDAKYHPAASPDVAAVPGVSVPDQLTDTADLSGVSQQSDLYDLTFRDVCRKSVGYRGPNPWGDYGDSSDYFVVLRHEGTVGGYDHKSKTGYNWLTALLVASGARRPSSSTLDTDTSDDEILQIWAYAKDKGLIPDDGENGKIPTRALTAYAKRHGIIDGPSDLKEKEYQREDGETSTFVGLSDEAYNRAITHFRENQSIDPVLTPRSDYQDDNTNGQFEGKMASDEGQSNAKSDADSTSEHATPESFSEDGEADSASGDLSTYKSLELFLDKFVEFGDPENPDHNASEWRIRSSELREMYNEWAEENGYETLSRSKFATNSYLMSIVPDYVEKSDFRFGDTTAKGISPAQVVETS
ncbi:TraM recognition domain-containing protein [Halobaculum sp. MBLA0147]|uniref:TraM recognition domain-containing protein n=1 Tax=Halobaculum sp. MBLA0147 TaxID=3079934 RepID=UPI0035234C03